jgi:hypothetical protein
MDAPTPQNPRSLSLKRKKDEKLAKKGDYFHPSNRHFVRVFPVFSAQNAQICARFAVAL